MNLLIIDDEPLTVQSLKDNMPWKKLGINEVYTAYEPRFARQLVTSLPIHIILCDIEMPGESGIDFLRWMKNETECDAITILLTCYDEFAYAKEGISLGVMEYLLKPVSYRDLGTIVQRAVKEYQDRQLQKKHIREGKLWEQNRSALVRSFWQDFFSSTVSQANQDVLGFSESTLFLLSIISIKGDSNALPDRDILILLEHQIRSLLADYGLEYTFITPKNGLIYLTAFSQSLGADNSAAADVIFQTIKELIFSMQINQVNLVGCMEGFCDISYIKKQEQAFLAFLKDVPEASGFFRLDSRSSGTGLIDQAVYDKSFNEAVNYIKHHIADDISRQHVADIVHMNADYLSRMFKKKTNLTLSEFIRQEKLNYSRHLLLNSDMSINDIAIFLNFSSQSHFSSVFKKQYGITPAEYRSR